MFLVDGDVWKSADGLANALRRSIGAHFHGAPANPVTIEDEAFPILRRLAVDLTSARIDAGNPPPNPSAIEAREPGVTARTFLVQAHPLHIEDAGGVNLLVDANNVELWLCTDRNHRRWLVPHRAGHGHAQLDIAEDDVANLFLRGAELAVSQHGVEIEDTHIRLSPLGDRMVRLEARVTARKFIFSATVTIRGTMRVDDELNAHFSDLHCSGDGKMGQLASAVIAPHLTKLEERALPLLGISLGEIRLHHAAVNVTDAGSLHVTARFGG